LNGAVPKFFITDGKKSKPALRELINRNPSIILFSARGLNPCSTVFRLLVSSISVSGIFTGQTSLHLPQSEEAKLRCEKSLNPFKNGVITEPMGPL
jgi:hypothetical protein